MSSGTHYDQPIGSQPACTCAQASSCCAVHPSIRNICGIETLGAKILIFAANGYIYHADESGGANTRKPRFEVSDAGVRIGCTFVTADAIRRIKLELDAFSHSKTKVVQP